MQKNIFKLGHGKWIGFQQTEKTRERHCRHCNTGGKVHASFKNVEQIYLAKTEWNV